MAWPQWRGQGRGQREAATYGVSHHTAATSKRLIGFLLLIVIQRAIERGRCRFQFLESIDHGLHGRDMTIQPLDRVARYHRFHMRLVRAFHRVATRFNRFDVGIPDLSLGFGDLQFRLEMGDVAVVHRHHHRAHHHGPAHPVLAAHLVRAALVHHPAPAHTANRRHHIGVLAHFVRIVIRLRGGLGGCGGRED